MARLLLQIPGPNRQPGVHSVIERTCAVLVVGDDVSVLADCTSAVTHPLRDSLRVAGVAVRGL